MKLRYQTHTDLHPVWLERRAGGGRAWGHVERVWFLQCRDRVFNGSERARVRLIGRIWLAIIWNVLLPRHLRELRVRCLQPGGYMVKKGPFMSRIALAVIGASLVALCHNGVAQDRTIGSGSIYVLNGLTSNFLMWGLPADLHEFDMTNGHLLSTTHIADGGDAGPDFIAADYPRRTVVLAFPRFAPTNFIVIDMDHPSSVRRVEAVDAYTDGRGPSTTHFFLEQPPHALELGIRTSKAPYRAREISGEIAKQPNRSRELRAELTTVMDTKILAVSLSGDAKSELLPVSVTKDARISGYFGTAFDNILDLYIAAEPGPHLRLSFGTGDVDLGIPSTKMKAQPGLTFLNVKNDDSIVVSSFAERTESQGGAGASIYHVYSNAGHVWNALTVPGARTTVRSFGRWLAFVVADTQPWAAKAKGSCCVEYDGNRHRVSPGKAERMQIELKVDQYHSATVDDVFMISDLWFPGILLLYDVVTGRTYRLETNQGDSEIILVDGSDAYYRVNTTLYRARIGNSTLDDITEIARDPAIGNVHWAFIPGRSVH